MSRSRTLRTNYRYKYHCSRHHQIAPDFEIKADDHEPTGVGHAPDPAHQSQEHMDIEDAEPARGIFLEEHCGSDAGLRQEPQKFLAADKAGPITQLIDGTAEVTPTELSQRLIGTMVGPYKLVSVLGHGGAGTVYLAERVDQQYSAEVAVKVVESAVFQADVLRHFRAERQILARLHHPYIARLIDAGETATSLPFLVMDYVRGEPIDRYCESRCLTLEQRLLLFLKVCEAVQFAHQNLVVHRDLKPANILVTTDGTPKLLDFGIAKPLDTNDGSALAVTRVKDRMLTIEYASPEQIMGKAITTGSDVYTLGVVLYELLTGVRPHARPSGNCLELERDICLKDPPKPSIAFAAQRTKMRRQLAGDLDAIVLRALRKEPERRYASVEQFSADVHRHLARKPVSARHGNWLYYTQRFLGRHIFGVCAGVFGICLLLVFTINTSMQSTRIAAERDRADVVSNFMLDVFSAADPFVAQGHEITARELLDKAAARINRELNQQPEVRARLLDAIGLAYYNQGQPDRAISYLQEAFRLHRQDGNSGVLTTNSLCILALALLDVGKFSESEKLFIDAMNDLRHRHHENSKEYAQLLKGLGGLEHSRGRISAAEQYMQQGLALSRVVYGLRHPEVAELSRNLANLMVWKQELPAAEQLARQAVDIYSASVSTSHPDRIFADALLGQILLLEGRTGDAASILERSLATQRLIFGIRSSQVINVLNELSAVRSAQGRYTEAEQLLREAIKSSTELFGQQHHFVGFARASLANSLLKSGRFAEAEEEARSALNILSAALPADHQYIASAEYQLGLVLLQTHQLPEAMHRLEDSMHRWERSGAPRWRAARSESALGEVLFKMGKRGEAEPHLITAYQTLAKELGENDGNEGTTRTAFSRLEHFYASQKRASAQRSNSTS